MAQPLTSSRRYRWQFSLRGLLLLTFLAGIGLMIYRWPWEETALHQIELPTEIDMPWWRPRDTVGSARSQKTMSAKTVTTYCRGWQGRRVQHGVARLFVEGRLVEERNYYESQLHGLSRCFDWNGRLTCETIYRGGQLHGPFRVGDGNTWVQSGHYLRDEAHGVWQTIDSRHDGRQMYFETGVGGVFSSYGNFHSSLSGCPHGWAQVPDEAIACRSEWLRGQRHGRFEWRSTSGIVLNTAEFVNDRLIRWNDEPVHSQLEAWLANNIKDDPPLRETLRQPASALGSGYFTQMFAHGGNTRDNKREFWLEDALQLDELQIRPSACCVFHFTEARPGNSSDTNQPTIAEHLLEWALYDGLMLDYRYGALWLVPASESSGQFRDPTGVERIYFGVDSPQASEWEQSIPLFARQAGEPLAWLEHVVAGTSIQLDLSALRAESPPKLVPAVGHWHCLRKRRDAFGLVLFRSGLQCEQRGNTIVVKPHWTGLESFRTRTDGTPNVRVFD